MTDTQKIALVTGASRGIGAEIARGLAADGVAVAVNYASSPEAAEAVVRQIEAAGGRAVALKADLSDAEAPAALFEAAEAELGPVDILVNNAGTMRLGPIASLDEAALADQLALNLAAPLRLMREAAARLADGGRILSLSSSVVGLYQPGYGVYAATKAGLEAVTNVLAKELAPRGITVNAVAPGPVATDFFLKGKSDALVAQIAAMNPFKRLGTPEDIAGVIRLLARDEAGWISGQVIRANGGVV
ncbi:3-oxoacyl-[acyl-carrier protein] reductase [Pseudooceanicola antarcticus]|uniref:3-ketoacyl-ACP reductase n=1 Tax=Pseudooceanicola antarcticus TaxID=1247613 RepID=A0A285IJF2_9RHOB|nr:SDR family oxidoreductase [Pseudooceanicola antarcticus]PJE28824.1 3-ketoacyl-ACP reductase [Pseudooceanicola antarcticus]SNY48119.1 3-oxoacyl-[acyl-carrier protein] reductase [Pseudooceanicola antarcticus]